VRYSIHDVHCARTDELQFFLVYPISHRQYVNFAGFTLQPDLVATAYEVDSRNPRPSFKGKTNNEWVSELTAEQLVQPFKNFEKDAQSILMVCHIMVRIQVTVPHCLHSA
jgi:hypothetical protein